MNAKHDLDALLTGPDDDDLPTSDAFVRTVMARVEQRRRQRRMALATVGGSVAAAACAALIALPVPTLGGTFGGPFNSMAVLLLAALCGVVWIDTDGTRAFAERS